MRVDYLWAGNLQAMVPSHIQCQTLGSLSQIPYVGKYVAENPAAPREVLARLAALSGHYSEETHQKVAQNPSAPPEALARLARDPRVKIRRAVAQNLSTPTDVLEALAKDPDPEVRQAAARSRRRE